MSPAPSVPGTLPNHQLDSATLHLPRILCLHGGGVNASIFQAQARVLIRALPGFRLVFAEGPYPSHPGPGIIPVYEFWGPFRRWLRWKPEHPPIDDDEASRAILDSLEMCKRRDPGTGPWVGLLGFSQGAKVAASVLYRQQINMERGNREDSDSYRFAVLMAGRGPLVFLSTDPDAKCPPGLVLAGQVSTANDPLPTRAPDVRLRLPTIHVHGLTDPGLYWHRDFLKRCHDPSTVTLVEWEGTHRIPLKQETVRRIAGEIYRVAREEGVNV
ncbi:esterase citA-like [Aspergillus terreus]|uniref:Esterase citA-like n=1 Tax=Aspergillus terreus TaxID=33178 RepID=A0A5M3Z2J8_ASPTE|nr:hypothetical protein ATETN484_0006023100 [Aspergillus terreus]GFF19971.1 esterase citA-like [Aspergillus terreus]